MGHSMVLVVPDRTHAASRSDAGSVAHVLPDLAPAGLLEYGPPKAGPGTSPAPI